MQNLKWLDSSSANVTDAEFDSCAKLMDLEFPEGDDASSWEVLSTVKDVAECVIYRKPLGDTGLYQYYAKGHFNNTDALISYLILTLDNEYRKTWDTYAIDIENIENIDQSLCIYWSCKFPWPLSNRDYLFWRKGRIDKEKGLFMTISKSCKHEKKPEFKNFVRVDMYGAMMILRQKGDKCEFKMLHCDDMKGSIPKTIVNWAVATGLPQYLKTMHGVAQKYPKDRVEEVKKKYNIEL